MLLNKEVNRSGQSMAEHIALTNARCFSPWLRKQTIYHNLLCQEVIQYPPRRAVMPSSANLTKTAFLLSFCVSPRAQHLLRNVPPANIKLCARAHDDEVWAVGLATATIRLLVAFRRRASAVSVCSQMPGYPPAA